jgi:hypothetical protein
MYSQRTGLPWGGSGHVHGFDGLEHRFKNTKKGVATAAVNIAFVKFRRGIGVACSI